MLRLIKYNIHRWYRAGWGRYTQADPLTTKGVALTDLYGYAAANPVRFSDPDGLVTVNQTFTRRGGLIGPGGNYDLAYGRITTNGTCVCVDRSFYIRLTLNFDHGWLCTGERACAIEEYHANIASAFVSRLAREWNQHERVPYNSHAQCLAAAQYFADDLRRNLLNPNRYSPELVRRYNYAQNDYEYTHHGWCYVNPFGCAWRP